LARDTNFYYSFLVLPAEKRRAIIAVWDFCRAVDDAVDEAQGVGARKDESAREEIASWRRELAACFDGGVPETRQGQALVPMIRRFDLPREPFEALIEGVEMDLGSRRYETFPDLYEYCIRVASAVGLICLNIFGYRDPKARQYAVDLGVALQLTNILRDVPVDLAQGRVYIPQEDLRAHGCTEADLQSEAAHAGHGVRSAAVKALLKQQAARAREYYGRAAKSLPKGDVRQLVAAEIMGAIYRAILHRIERSDYDVFSRIVRIPRPRRALIAAATWARAVLLP
jgi:15-cis-phytoene synthase